MERAEHFLAFCLPGHKDIAKVEGGKSAGVEAFLVGHPEISREYLGKLAGLEVEK